MSHPQPAALSAVVDNNEEWQPHAAEEFQQVGTVGKIAIGLLGASVVTHLLSTWSDWNTYGVVDRYLGGMPNAENADLNRADAIAKVTAVPNVIISVAAAVVFVIWLWRARVNSEVLCQADHRRGHGWVLASWFCPGPNLWYPKQIVDDVWLASDPKTPVYADDLRRFRPPMLTSVWWTAWVGALLFDVVVRRVLMSMEPTVGSLRGIALAGTASLVLIAAAAVSGALVIRRINEMQTGREWIPWWDQREPKLTAVPTYAEADTSEQQAIAEPVAVPALRLERSPELQPAGVGAIAGPDGRANAGFGGGRGFGAAAEDEAPKWSPFAPAAQDEGPATQAFSPVESWREEAPQNPFGGPAHPFGAQEPAAAFGGAQSGAPLSEARSAGFGAPQSPGFGGPQGAGFGGAQVAGFGGPQSGGALGGGSEGPSWGQPSSPLVDEVPADSPFAPTGTPFTPESSPFAPAARPEYEAASEYTRYDEPAQYGPEPKSQYDTSTDDLIATALSRWQSGPATSPSLPAVPADPFSYQPAEEPLTRTTESYDSSWSGYDTAPEPEPAPVARAGRRAARVAVDSPSAIQPIEHSQPVEHSRPAEPSYGEFPTSPRTSLPDDFLTPSAPLPPVPPVGPEPQYTPETGYTDYRSTSYSSYDPEPEYTSYTSSYTPDSLTSSSYDSYSSSSSDYTSYESSYDQYSSPSYETTNHSSYYGDHSSSYSTKAEYQPAAEEPAQEQPSTPRTHPRRRWV